MHRFAFTIAELLIVFGIIGIISMRLIPALIETQKELITVVELKRTLSVTTSALNRAIAENGSPDGWALGSKGDAQGLANLNDNMLKYLKVEKNCGTGAGCFSESNYKNLDGDDVANNINQNTDYTKVALVDGTSLAYTQLSDNCSDVWGSTSSLQNVCGIIIVDINGAKSPNKYGTDTFGYLYTKFDVVPVGSPAQSGAEPINEYCNLSGSSDNTVSNGLGCSAWVVYNENTDYKDCDDLSWYGKTVCGTTEPILAQAPPPPITPPPVTPPNPVCTPRGNSQAYLNDNNGKNNKNFKNGNDNSNNNGNNNCNYNY